MTLLRSSLLVSCFLIALPSLAASADASPNPVWNLVMVLIVLLVTAGSAVLPVSALRFWQGYWKLVAAVPLLVLAAWAGWIALSKFLLPASHALWLFEIFAWAMLSMLYMATAFTAKRQFEKADNPVQAPGNDPDQAVRHASKPPSKL